MRETFVLTLEATDADDEELTFDVPNIPPGASFNATGNRLFFMWRVTSTEEVLCLYVKFPDNALIINLKHRKCAETSFWRQRITRPARKFGHVIEIFLHFYRVYK